MDTIKSAINQSACLTTVTNQTLTVSTYSYYFDHSLQIDMSLAIWGARSEKLRKIMRFVKPMRNLALTMQTKNVFLIPFLILMEIKLLQIDGLIVFLIRYRYWSIQNSSRKDQRKIYFLQSPIWLSSSNISIKWWQWLKKSCDWNPT